MVDLNAIRTTVVKGLREYLGIPVIRSNQTGNPPAYPYCSYTITTLASSNNGTWGVYDDGKDRNPFTQTWSITVQSDDVADAMNLALKAKEWLEHVGTVYLNEHDVIVQSVTNITNRDNLLTVEYEHRNGFDVVFWFLGEVESTVEQNGIIEGVELEGVPLIEPVDVDDLAEKLEKRLGGDL